jgi:two-component system chemotaxis response regulator CheY
MATKHKILVVDDSEFVRSYHAHILEQAQFETVTAVDGADGLEKLFSGSIDLILTDINMTRMDGYEFIRRVRAETRYRSLPVIIVSTESEARDKIRGFQAGANLYIVKPCAPETMLEHVRMILSAAAPQGAGPCPSL